MMYFRKIAIPMAINHLSKTTPRFWCSELNKKILTVADNHSVSYTINEQIKGTHVGGGGIYMLMFTCGPCGNKMARTFTKDAYHKGVVLIRCDSCDNVHLIADNLGWFEDDTWNVEKHAQSQGTPLPKIKNEEVNALLQNFLKNK